MSQSLIDILTSGCDERIFLTGTENRNKYHLQPLMYEGLMQRGSCTCSPMNKDGHEVAEAFMEEIQVGNYQEVVAEQTRSLQNLLKQDYLDQFQVMYGPSGSDAMYIPLMFQAISHPGESIVNIVTSPEELGSGSKAAAEGKYYAGWNQMGETIPIGETIEGAPEVINHFIAARDKQGNVADHKKAIRKIIKDNLGKPIIGNLVFGSKSGIMDDLNIIDEFPDGVMWVVDMCQFRADRQLIHELITKGVMLMVTGSKFFQAPPFCGALLVPKTITSALSSLDASPAAVFGKLFTKYDFPHSLTGIREQLPDFQNWGLRMRWQIAIKEMEAYMAIPASATNAWIRRWNRVVAGRLAMSDTFELMPDMELSNDSIISFIIKANGRELLKDELKVLFDQMVTEEHEGLGDHQKVFMGQPVTYGKSAFIRLALGSYSVRKQMEKGKFDLRNDLRLVDIIEEKVLTLFG